MSDQRKIMERIRLLLAKAEGTENEHEADAFLAKAQALMTDSTITEAMIRAAKPHDSREKPIQRTWDVPNPYANQKADLLMGILRAQSCKTVWRPPSRYSNGATVYGIGFDSDLELVDGLYTHLLAQMVRQVMKVRPDGTEREVWSERDYCYKPVSTRMYRANWAEGFATHVCRRLEEAAQLRKGEVETEQGESVALALVDRDAEIANYFKELYPRLGKGRARYRNSSAGYSAGREAGARADIGNRSFGGNRRALGA